MSTDASSSGRRRSIDDPDSLIAASASAAQPAGQQQQQQAQPSTSQSMPDASSAAGAMAPSSDAIDGEGDGDDADEAEIAAMRARVAEMEAEAAKLRELTAASEAAAHGGAGARAGGDGADGAGGEDVNMSDEDRAAVDARSIYVGNVSSLSTVGRFCGQASDFRPARSTTARRRKRFSSTLRPAEPSTASPSSLTSSPDPRGESPPPLPAIRTNGRITTDRRARGFTATHMSSLPSRPSSRTPFSCTSPCSAAASSRCVPSPRCATWP